MSDCGEADDHKKMETAKYSRSKLVKNSFYSLSHVNSSFKCDSIKKDRQWR